MIDGGALSTPSVTYLLTNLSLFHPSDEHAHDYNSLLIPQITITKVTMLVCHLNYKTN